MNEMDGKFCNPQGRNFQRWDMIDVSIWKLHSDDAENYWGQPYLYLYKDSFIKFHKTLIFTYAQQAKIPALLLASVAWQEAGGKPDDLKPQVLLFRQLIDYFHKNNDYSNKVSIGVVAMQIRVVAETLGIDPRTLSTTQQLQISQCLQTDSFNLKIVAMHLYNLIKHDYPNADTLNLTDEQLILVGARYNRGVERKKDDFIQAISLDAKDPRRNYISYGLAILKRREHIKKLLGIS
ncbi:hypothetical protein AB1E22_00990 [Buttiauxella gaviniae]|uniref:Transglycosylase SLT domain-containing protein n=1 Tax=Buttiauxella gaviniae TaxID=82990 RepID=A0ABV3NP52_9ENTR